MRRSERGGGLVKLVLLLAFVFALGALAWMLLLPVLVSEQVRTRTGFEVDVRAVAVNPFTGRAVVRGLVIENPPEFPTPDFVQLRDFEAELELASLLGSQVVLERVSLDIGRLGWVRRRDGVTNLALFEQRWAPAGGRKTAGEPRRWLVRRLDVRLDRVVLADYAGEKPSVREVDVGMERTFRNVSRPAQLLVPELLRVAPPGSWSQAAVGAAQRAGEKTGRTMMGLVRTLEEKIKP